MPETIPPAPVTYPSPLAEPEESRLVKTHHYSISRRQGRLPTKDAGQPTLEVVSAFATIELNGCRDTGHTINGTISPPQCVGPLLRAWAGRLLQFDTYISVKEVSHGTDDDARQ
jgi:hypothetical protein